MAVAADTLARAIEEHRAGRIGEATRLYRRLLADDPALYDPLQLLGLIARQEEGVDGGVRLLRRALRVQPGDWVATYNLGNFLFDLGRFEEVERLTRQAVAVSPGHAAALERLARIGLVVGRPQPAETLLRRVERLGGGGRLPLMLERARMYRGVAAAAADPSLPPGLVVRGVFRDTSGYAHKVRQFVRHLVEAGVRVQLMDLLYMPSDAPPLDELPAFLDGLDRPVRAKAVLSFTTPPAVEAVPGLMTVNYSVFEATRIPANWIIHSVRHDHVVVATPSSRDAWVAAGMPAGRVAVCPEGVEPVDPAALVPLDLRDGSGRRLRDYRTRIINISDFNLRKNMDGLLRVWMRAARRDDDAALVIKIGKGDDVAQHFGALVRKASAEVGVAVDAMAPIFVMDGRYSDETMLSLLAAGTHYWSMSHGEGWDLPMAQAGSMGLTLLAPAHSAYTAYLDESVAHMLPSAVTPGQGGYAGLDWWTPDEDAATDLLARIIRDPDAHRRSARAHLVEQYSWKRAAERLIDALRGMGAL